MYGYGSGYSGYGSAGGYGYSGYGGGYGYGMRPSYYNNSSPYYQSPSSYQYQQPVQQPNNTQQEKKTKLDDNNANIQTAIQFLSHPRTGNASLWDKVKFLQRKGLSPQQIYAAVQAVDPTATQHEHLHLMLFGHAQPKQRTWLDIAKWVTGAGSAIATVAGLLILIQKWRQPNDEQEIREEVQEQEVKEEMDSETKQTMEELSNLRNDLSELNRALRSYNSEISAILRQLAAVNQKRKQEQRLSTTSISDIKSGTYQKAQLPSSIKALFSSSKKSSDSAPLS